MAKKSRRHSPLKRALGLIRWFVEHRFGGTIDDVREELGGLTVREAYRYIKALREAGINIESAGRQGNIKTNFRLREVGDLRRIM